MLCADQFAQIPTKVNVATCQSKYQLHYHQFTNAFKNMAERDKKAFTDGLKYIPSHPNGSELPEHVQSVTKYRKYPSK